MSGHTPGPWKQFAWDTHRPEHRTIGAVIDGVRDHLFDADLSEADARLIAAAPDLLEALKLAVRAMGAHGDEDLSERAFRMARAAIAKAEGRPDQDRRDCERCDLELQPEDIEREFTKCAQCRSDPLENEDEP